MQEYIIGMDGGGTKTEIHVAGMEGAILHTIQAGAINCNGETEENVIRNIVDALAKIQELAGSLDACRAICIGAAGISNPHVEKVLRYALQQAGYKGQALIVGDHQTAMAGALGKTTGVILISGTGSICYGRNDKGEEHRTGGFGHLIDDEGSGYYIGKEILRAVVRAYDGRDEQTALTELVFQRLEITDIHELISFIYDANRNKRDFAALADLLPQARAVQDDVAQSIVESCASALEGLIIPVVGKLGLDRDILALSGGILQKDFAIRTSLTKKMHLRYPHLQCILPTRNAAWGAVLLSREIVSSSPAN